MAKKEPFRALLNPERVEQRGGQNQLYERSTEKGFSKEKLEEETEGKIWHGFLSIGGILAGPNLAHRRVRLFSQSVP